MYCQHALVLVLLLISSKGNDVFSARFTFFFIAVLDITLRKHDGKYLSSLPVRCVHCVGSSSSLSLLPLKKSTYFSPSRHFAPMRNSKKKATQNVSTLTQKVRTNVNVFMVYIHRYVGQFEDVTNLLFLYFKSTS